MTGSIDFQFLHPQWLLLLIPLWALLWIYARQSRHKSAWRRICDPHLLAHMSAQRARPGGQASATWVIGILLTLGIVAAAAPSWSKLSNPLLEANTARVIVIDLSRAMLVEDLKPNRYQHAYEATSELIGNGFDGETGLVVFAGAAFLLSPLSRDAETLQAFVDAMAPETMPQDGSNLAQAILRAQDLLSASLGGYGHILLITAGDSKDSFAVDAAAAAASLGHRVSVLVIGSRAGGPLRDDDGALLRDGSGNIVLSRPNIDLLRQIVKAGDGALAFAGSEPGSDDLLTSRLSASNLVETGRGSGNSGSEAADDGIWLLWLMLPAALLLFRRNLLLVLPLLWLMPGEQGGYAAEPDYLWQHPEQIAFDAYRMGDYQTTIDLSQSSELRAAAFYRRGQYSKALELYDDENSAILAYNRANTLVQLQRYSEAVSAYERALELDPVLDIARYNQRLLEQFLLQQAESMDNLDGDNNDSSNIGGETQQDSSLQIGIATEPGSNPADEPEAGPGAGASQQSGQVDLMERFDGNDDEQVRFIPRAREPEQMPSDDLVERWISSLPETSTDLYRRKFLRDFTRQQRQPR